MSAELMDRGVRGAFYTLVDAVEAVEALEEKGFAPEDITLFSPIPTGEIEEHFDRPRSPVRYFTLAGGILGCITGFVLTYWTFFAWPLHVGGKPVSSFPVTVVIMFELTVLLGGLFSLAAVFIFSRIPALTVKPGYHARFSEDLFGVFVHTSEEEGKRNARDVLDGLGALEVGDEAL
jgi:molybdopterin-containing oxidoreductase family membrane subunit